MFFVFVPIGLEQLFVKVCFRRCHCAPSMFTGPDGKSMVAMPCVVVAMVWPSVESQVSGCSKIRTAPTSGGFLISSKMSSVSKLMMMIAFITFKSSLVPLFEGL